jgi:hypothetical protein
MSWTSCNHGTTIGTTGSEMGEILRDEEHEMGARIELEQCGHTPFAITCGTYGVMAHTAIAGALIEAGDAYDAMKVDLEMLLNIWPDDSADEETANRFHDAISALVAKY